MVNIYHTLLFITIINILLAVGLIIHFTLRCQYRLLTSVEVHAAFMVLSDLPSTTDDIHYNGGHNVN